MINEKTLRILGDNGFGIDVDALESYLVDYQIAAKISDMSEYTDTYNELLAVFQEIKPMSIMFDEHKLSNIVDECNDSEDVDVFFKQLGNPRPMIMYGDVDTQKISEIENLHFGNDVAHDIVAVMNVSGLDLMIQYINGNLCSIYGISESIKQYDFINQLYDNVPEVIEQFKDKGIVELRCKATLRKEDVIKNVMCETAGYLRRNIYIEKIHLVFYDVFMADYDGTYWDKLILLESIGLEVPERCMLRNIDSETFRQAMVAMDENFSEVELPNYKYHGFLVKKNSYTHSSGFIVNYDTYHTSKKYLFTSKAKSIMTKGTKHFLRIVPVKCNNHLTIDSIELKDIYDIEKFGVCMGSKVRFIVINGKAVLK